MSNVRHDVTRKLRSYRAELLAKAPRRFQLLSVDGFAFGSECPLFKSLGAALERARLFGASVCRVREWAGEDSVCRVHVQTSEWLLSWGRVDMEGVDCD